MIKGKQPVISISACQPFSQDKETTGLTGLKPW
jgi:hypothetical protein